MRLSLSSRIVILMWSDVSIPGVAPAAAADGAATPREIITFSSNCEGTLPSSFHRYT